MIEMVDRWVLPLAGRTVTRCCVDQALRLDLWAPGVPHATIRIEGAFTVQRAGRDFSLPRPADEPSAMSVMLSIVDLKVDHAFAFKGGALEVAFADESSLRVEPDPDFEAWELTGSWGLSVVSLPGEDLAIWEETSGNKADPVQAGSAVKEHRHGAG